MNQDSTKRAETCQLSEPRDESESGIRRQVAALLELGPRRGVGRLIANVRDQSLKSDWQRVETIIKALCAQNSPWRSEFKKVASGRRKSPARLRRRLTDWLTQPSPLVPRDARLTADNVIRRARTARSDATLTIDHSDELGWGPEHRVLIAKLHKIRQRGTPVDLQLRFSCEQLYVHGLGLLAAWCERYAAKVRLLADSEYARRYLDATGFRRVVEDGVTIDEPLYDQHNHVALTSIHREDEEAAEQVAPRVVELFSRHAVIEQSTWVALTIMFAELVENVYRHASSTVPAYVMAQAFPKTQKLHIVIADTGIGVHDSFRKSGDVKIRERARSEQASVEMALEKLVTSKIRRHKGYGLFIVKRLVQLNGGVMRLMTGCTTKRFSTIQRGRRRSELREEWIPHQKWQGTEVTLMFNLDKALPLLDVYRELGPPEDQADFFS